MIKRSLTALAGATFGALFCVGIAVAASVTQDFKAQGQLPQGAIVSLEQQASQVAMASSESLTNLYGVVVRNGDLAFSQSSEQGTVPVANTGVVDTLVSNNNGQVNAGDPITVDNIAGVGQKATKSGKIIGIAQSALNEQDSSVRRVTVDNKSVIVATIPVKIEVSDYSVQTGSNEVAANRNKALQIADSLAGKQVKPYAIIIAGILLLIGIFVSVFLVTSSGYASMISIGRNPLSEKRIIKSLIRMLVISVGIFTAGIALAYAVLRIL